MHCLTEIDNFSYLKIRNIKQIFTASLNTNARKITFNQVLNFRQKNINHTDLIRSVNGIYDSKVFELLFLYCPTLLSVTTFRLLNLLPSLFDWWLFIGRLSSFLWQLHESDTRHLDYHYYVLITSYIIGTYIKYLLMWFPSLQQESKCDEGLVPGVLSPGVKRGRGVMLTTHPHLLPRSWMSRSYTPLPPSASMSCRGTALLAFY
jgi:hypothetical protein